MADAVKEVKEEKVKEVEVEPEELPIEEGEDDSKTWYGDERDDEPVAEADAADGDDETAEASEDEDASDDAEDEMARRAEDAEHWGRFKSLWEKDPVAFMKHYAAHMTPEQQAALASALDAKPAEPEVALEAQSPVEEHYLKHAKEIEQLPKFAQGVASELDAHNRFINEANIGVAVLEAKLSAVLDLLETKLPDVDMKKLFDSLDGKASYAELVEKHYKPALVKALKTAKQEKRARPDTPGDGSALRTRPSKGTSMAEIFRQT